MPYTYGTSASNFALFCQDENLVRWSRTSTRYIQSQQYPPSDNWRYFERFSEAFYCHRYRGQWQKYGIANVWKKRVIALQLSWSLLWWQFFWFSILTLIDSSDLLNSKYQIHSWIILSANSDRNSREIERIILDLKARQSASVHQQKQQQQKPRENSGISRPE